MHYVNRSLPVVLAAILVLSCSGLRIEKRYGTGMVVTSSPIASGIGLQVLKSGGNAFDAAVAVGFALAVCYPEAGNIGGGGFALLYSGPTGLVTALDFRETAPSAATSDMYLDSSGMVVPEASLLGARAAGVPGTVAGLYTLWKEHGSLEWYELVKPAIDLADTGFVVSEELGKSFQAYRQQLSRFAETGSIFAPGGPVLQAGERLVQKDLALTLERIGLDSLDGFYAGHTADRIVATMSRHGGLISHDDLKKYRPTWRVPISFAFDSLEVYSMSPPSSGGIMLGEILLLLEPYDFYTYSPDHPEYIHLFTEACRLAYADRAVPLGDPDFVQNPVRELLDSAYLDSRRKLIHFDRAGVSREIGSGLSNSYSESESTTHFSIADKYGNIVSLTYTINTSFGSKLIV
ncbi:MAG: gamma-glutamyltransferase, partial [Candidatus Zixiibacteriota bacterium]